MNPPHRPTVSLRSHRRTSIKTYVHHDSHVGWLDIAGPLSPPTSPRNVLAQLRRAHGRLPDGIEVVVLDLTKLDDIAIELAVLLCLESRMLAVRGIRLAVALRRDANRPPGVRIMLDRLELWPIDEDQLGVAERAMRSARHEEHGWTLLPVLP